MRHFVQYHNPTKMGEYDPAEGDYIVTNKTVGCCAGDRVWLISRRGEPKNYEYFLCKTFLAESIGPNSSRRFPDFRYSVKGSDGKSFDQMAIDQEPWFERLRMLDGNFAFGLQPINDAEVVKGLSWLAKLP